jgi:hypothetical protein
LPYRERLQAAFGAAHDLSNVSAHVGGRAEAASARLGALAYTVGERVAFRQPPDLRLAAHEAAHVIQQRHGVSTASSGWERAADAVAARVVAGRSAMDLLPAPAGQPQNRSTLQLQAATQSPSPDEQLIAIIEFWDQQWQAYDPGPDRAKARRVFLLLNRQVEVKTDQDVDRFVDECETLAASESDTWDALVKDGMTDSFFIENGEAFPTTFADKLYSALHLTSDQGTLASTATKNKSLALGLASVMSDEIWDRGLPISIGQAAQIRRSDIAELALSFNHAKKAPNEAISKYTKAVVDWERAETHYWLVHWYEWALALHLDQIRKGEVIIDADTYAQLTSTKFIQIKIKVFENAASSPDDMKKALNALMLATPAKFFRGGLGHGMSYAWPQEALDALATEIQKADDKIAAAGFTACIWRALVWGYERDYLIDEVKDAFLSIIDDPVKTIGTILAIIGLQAIPGVDVAVDIVLIAEFGLDILDTAYQLYSAFKDAGSAKSVVEMEHASAKISSTLAGTAAKLFIWAVTWGIGKGVKKLAKWRKAKEFLEANGNSAEAREALANAKGDAAKAEEALAAKRAEEQAARERAAAKQQEEEAAAERKRQADAKRKADEEAAAAERQREAEAKRKADEEAAAAERQREAEAKRKADEEAAAAERERKKQEAQKAEEQQKPKQEPTTQQEPRTEEPKKPKGEGKKPEEKAKKPKEEQKKPKEKPKKPTPEDPYRPCFVAGVLVATPTGAKPIENLVSGAAVLGRPEHAADVAESTSVGLVAEVHRGRTRELIHVRAMSESVTCTPRHPFFVRGRGWSHASDLAAGDELVGLDGQAMRLTAVERQTLPTPCETFNLRVPSLSTYFVRLGRHGVLVHNGGDDDFGRTLYWFFGKKPRARSSGNRIDDDGLSVWRTDSREGVNTLFDSRVNASGRDPDDPHGYFTEEQLKEAGMVVPETPGDPKSPLTGKLPHHSVRPSANPDPKTKLTAPEIEALDAKLKGIKTPVVEPQDLTC